MLKLTASLLHLRQNFALVVALFACGVASSPGAAEPSPAATTPRPTSSPTPATAQGPVEPATVGNGPDSIATRLHSPKNAGANASDAAAQFYCDISAQGDVENTYRVVAKQDEFREAVQSALDWGHFKPARLNGRPVAAYVAGTILFLHRDGQPVIVVSLATQDRERVGKLANYIQPQLIEGLRRRLEIARAALPYSLVVVGSAEVVVKVSDTGALLSTALMAENPKGTGLGTLVESALKGAQFTPAYLDGKAVPGEINVVATFSDAPADAE
ncbi:MAG: hypothetical protein ABI871_02080 [Chthoniobacterales bacterium]